jgi:hypothetical protein
MNCFKVLPTEMDLAEVISHERSLLNGEAQIFVAKSPTVLGLHPVRDL